MVELLKDKQTNLQFSLNIEGNTEKPLARLVILLNNGLNFSVNAAISNDGAHARVEIPPLKSVIKETIIIGSEAYLEVIVDESYFIPWNDKIKIKESIKITASIEPSSQLESTDEKIKTTDGINISASLNGDSKEDKKEDIKKKKEKDIKKEKVKKVDKPLKKKFWDSNMSAKEYINRM